MDLAFLLQEPADEYRKRSQDYLTSHQLGDFRKCPLLFSKKKRGLVEDEDRPAYLLGRAAHMLILEGKEQFDRCYAIGGPVNPRTGKPFGANTQAYQDWSAQQAAEGRECLTDEQAALIRNMAEGARAHARVRELLAEGVAEHVVRAEYCGLQCQARMDWFHPVEGIVDLKTCDDLTWFEADAKRYSYAHQLAFYRALVARVTGEVVPVYLIGLEKKEPFRCGVWLVSEQTLAYCQSENEAAIERLKQCVSSNSWPTGYEELRVFDSI